MKSTPKPKRPVAAETIARLADNGKDVSRFFRSQESFSASSTAS